VESGFEWKDHPDAGLSLLSLSVIHSLLGYISVITRCLPVLQ